MPKFVDALDPRPITFNLELFEKIIPTTSNTSIAEIKKYDESELFTDANNLACKISNSDRDNNLLIKADTDLSP